MAMEGSALARKLAIVPAYNEAEAIARTVVEIRERAPDFDVLVVDDGSTDATAEQAMAAGATLVRLPVNQGIGGAMQTGYLYACQNDYDVAVQLDGDGQHDPRYLDGLLKRLVATPGVDMVVGSRFLDDDRGAFRSSAARRAGIRIFARVLSLITGQRVTDPTSGMRMTNRRAIHLFADDYPHDYPEVEAILLMHVHRLRCCEVPVRMRPRTTGESAISSWRSAYYMLKVLLAIAIGLCRRAPESRYVELSTTAGPSSLTTISG